MDQHEAPLAVVILAAGHGSRMLSATPKPLHAIGGRSLLGHVLAAAGALDPAQILVVSGALDDAVGRAAREISPSALIVAQPERRGTGDAVRRALPHLRADIARMLVLYADTPLLQSDTLRAMSAAEAHAAVLGFEAVDPTGYGRLVLDGSGALERIVEDADATEGERAARLCNAGAMALDAAAARRWLPALRADNAGGEFYLTDLVAMARAEGAPCAVVVCAQDETLGVNSRADLAAAEAAFQRRARARALADGATLAAPETVFFSHDTRLGRDAIVGPHVVFGPGVELGDGARVEAFCHLEGCLVSPGAVVGPFARLRPGARIGADARVGNFVEVKNAILGDGAKANHLAYLGDAEIGPRANVGAGTITCNYDGVAKHRTEIGADAFIGSNSALVAPVSIGAGAYVASGSVVTRDVAPDALAVARARQIDRPGFAARLRAKFRLTSRN